MYGRTISNSRHPTKRRAYINLSRKYGVLGMTHYKVTITINVQADDEDHAYEQALELLSDGQFTPEIEEA